LMLSDRNRVRGVPGRQPIATYVQNYGGKR
jgi:hypothetical protein